MKISDLEGNYLYVPYEDEEIEIMLLDIIEYQGTSFSCFTIVDDINTDGTSQIYIHQGNLLDDVDNYKINLLEKDDLYEIILKLLDERNPEILAE